MAIDAWYQQAIQWHATGDAAYPYQAFIDGQVYRIRINDFPAEPLYTLLHGEQEVCSFDDWSPHWSRPARAGSRS